MKKWFFILTLTMIFIAGCQSNAIQEVENNHGDFTNLEELDEFSKSVQSGKKTEINYIQYGVEGQRGVRHLSYDGNKLNVSHSVDEEFIEEFQCEGIEIQTNNSETVYTLKQCTKDIGDLDLATVQNNKK